MLYLTFDPVTTFLLPYFIGIIYFAIACWVNSELSDPETITIAPVVRPERVFNFLEEVSTIDELIAPIKPTVSRRSCKSPVVISTTIADNAPTKKPRSKSKSLDQKSA